MVDRTLLVCACLVVAALLFFTGAGLLFMTKENTGNAPPGLSGQKINEKINPATPGPGSMQNENSGDWQGLGRMGNHDGQLLRERGTGPSCGDTINEQMDNSRGNQFHCPMSVPYTGDQNRPCSQSGPSAKGQVLGDKQPDSAKGSCPGGNETHHPSFQSPRPGSDRMNWEMPCSTGHTGAKVYLLVVEP